MTTNQTIDGVPRELMISFPRELSDELAELIAEKARVCGGGAFDIWEAICEQFGTPASLPQGEPVAWMFKYLSHGDSPPYRSFEVTDFHQNPKAPGIAQHTPLYAEQPAPVAVAHTMQSVMEAVERSKEYTVLTSNQCAALAVSLNTK